MLRGLIDKITVEPTDDGYDVELVGDIVQMLEVPGTPGGSVPELFKCSVKVVAGAGNQRYLQLTFSRIPRLSPEQVGAATLPIA